RDLYVTGVQTCALPISALILAMLVAGVLGVGIGSTSIAPGRALAALAGHGDPIERAILIELRLPRAILGLAVGAMLGLAGAALRSEERSCRERVEISVG